MAEKIWYEDLQGFVEIDKLFNVFPTEDMSLEEKLNSILRLCIYIGVVLALLRVNSKFLFIPIIGGLVSYPLYEFEKREKNVAEKFLKDNEVDIKNGKLCSRTTVENPFSNPSIVDIQYNPNRPRACGDMSEQAQKNYEKRVFVDVTDVYGRDVSSRQFYTVPSTTIPGDQPSFAEWLYGTGATCKQGNGLECDYKAYRYINR